MKKQCGGLRRVFSVVCIIFSFICSFLVTTVSAETVELKVSSWTPAFVEIAKITERWAKKIEEMSGGDVKFTFYWSATLAAYKDSYRVMQSGVADIGNYVIGINPNLHPLHEMTSLPFFGWDDIFVATNVYHELRRKYPQFDAEFKGLRNIYTTVMAPSHFHFTKHKIVLPKDLKGTRIAATGKDWSKLLPMYDSAPVAMGPPDWYMSLQKGLVDGVFLHWPGVDSFKLEELTEYHVDAGDAGFGLALYGWWINERSWNKLSERAKKAIIITRDWAQQEDLLYNYQAIETGRKRAEAAGHTVHYLTPEERKEWEYALKFLHEEWIEEATAKGYPAREIYNYAQELIAHFNAERNR